MKALISNILNSKVNPRPRTKIIDETLVAVTGAGAVTPTIQEAWVQAWEEADGSYSMWFKIRASHTNANGPHTYTIPGAVGVEDPSPSLTVNTEDGGGTPSFYISAAGKPVITFSGPTNFSVITGTIALTGKPTWFDTYAESDADGISLASANVGSVVSGSGGGSSGGGESVSVSEATTSTLGTVKKSSWSKHVVENTVTADGTFLTLSNLTVGSTYIAHVNLTGVVNDNSTDLSVRARVVHNGSTIDVVEGYSNSTQEVSMTKTVFFTAAATSVSFEAVSASSASYISAHDLDNDIPSYVVLEEANHLVEDV